MEIPFDPYGEQLIEQLREQVSNLMAATQLLTPAIREQGDRKYDQYLAILNQSLYRLLRMINHVGCFQRLEQGEEGQIYHPGPLDVARLCQQLAGQVSPLAAQAGVAFHYEGDRETMLLRGDSGLLQQALLNLISNALRAAGKGGEAGLRLSSSRGWAVLTVWDSGKNGRIPEECHPSNERLERKPGLGMGIQLARQIAALHGGALVFEHREERGVHAVLSLPVEPGSEGDTLRTPKMEYEAMGGFSRVLVELSSILPFEAFLQEEME